ncbi:MAG: AsnC family transcriptional regulator [Candidatus Nitrosocosmicus sp.]|nr:AsnC family transcriptional regulator [Candidatus Nitrosocosmicus sp.]MDN5868247.1 AsnC family transcriptional regulator [Candidatus Nitrosocosmicus sp.]
MPINLDDIDVSILNSILEDGRKSFRQISRDTGITTPTVKARYERLVNVGFIKGVLPVFDFEKIESGEEKNFIQLGNLKENVKRKKNIGKNHHKNILKEEVSEIQKKISSGLAINIVCDFCEGPVYGKPKILKFANIERFFCCISCKSGYSQKYRGRMESIKRKYEGKSELDE